MKEPSRTTTMRICCLGRRSLRVVLACTVMSFFVLFQLQGCTSARDFTALEIRHARPMLKKTVPETDRLRLAVMPFEDLRTDTTSIGSQRDWLGTATVWTVVGDHVGDMIAEVMVDHLKRSFGWEAWIVRPAILPPDQGADMTLTGTILMFEAHALPEFGDTKLAVTIRVRLNATETISQQVLSETIEETVTRQVWWFEPYDMELLINSALRNQLDRFRLHLHNHGLVRS